MAFKAGAFCADFVANDSANASRLFGVRVDVSYIMTHIARSALPTNK